MKIMFICSGNICRSAMAHWMLKKKIDEAKTENITNTADKEKTKNDIEKTKNGIEKTKNIDNTKEIEVYSSGTSAFTGDIPTEEATEVMQEYGVDLTKHRATNMVESNIKEMDLILCATNIHKMHVVSRYPELKEKAYTIKEYVNYNEEGHDPINIKAPWGYNIATYRYCAAEIEKCLEILTKKLEKRK